MFETIFVAKWPFWVGGLAIGAFAIIFLLLGKKPLGVSTGYEDACAAPFDKGMRRSWRLPFLVGIIGGGLIAALVAGKLAATTAVPLFDSVVSAPLWAKAAIFVGGGLLIGFGTRLAGGCTSGHGIVGVSLLAPSSLITTGAFMASGFVVTNLLLRTLGS